MGDPSTNEAAGTMMALYRRHLDTCRQMADVMLDTTARLEQIGLNVARDAVHGSFDAAKTAGSGDMAAAKAPGPEGLLTVQREIADTMGKMSGEMVRLMGEYGSGLTQTLGATMHSNPLPPGTGFEALTQAWNDTMQRFGTMMQSTMPTGAAGAKARTTTAK